MWRASFCSLSSHFIKNKKFVWCPTWSVLWPPPSAHRALQEYGGASAGFHRHTPVSALLHAQERRWSGRTCPESSSFLHVLHHSWPPWLETINRPHVGSGVTLVIITAGHGRFDCYGQRVPMTKQDVDIKQEHVNILQRLPQSVLTSVQQCPLNWARKLWTERKSVSTRVQ